MKVARCPYNYLVPVLVLGDDAVEGRWGGVVPTERNNCSIAGCCFAYSEQSFQSIPNNCCREFKTAIVLCMVRTFLVRLMYSTHTHADAMAISAARTSKSFGNGLLFIPTNLTRPYSGVHGKSRAGGRAGAEDPRPWARGWHAFGPIPTRSPREERRRWAAGKKWISVPLLRPD